MPAPAPTAGWRGWLRRWRPALYRLGLLAGAALLLYQIGIGVLGLRQARLTAETVPGLAAATLVVFVGVGLQVVAWTGLMRALGVDLTLRDAVRGYYLSFLPRYLPGTIWGYLSRTEWLARQHQVPPAVAHIGSLFELAAVLASNGLVLAAYWLDLAQPGAGLVVVAGALACGGAAWAARRRASRPEISSPTSLHSVLRWPMAVDLAVASATLLVVWLCYGAGIWLTAVALQVPTSGGVLGAAFAFGLAWLAGFVLVFVPAGLGVREIALSGLLGSAVGLSPATGTAIAVMSRLLILLSELGWVMVGVGLGRSVAKKAAKMPQ